MGSTRLDVHVKKGLADGLYISSVGCASDLWGIIMDAGTGFSQQLYRVVPDAFLPKEWIMEKWDLGYYITAVAGDASTPLSTSPHKPLTNKYVESFLTAAAVFCMLVAPQTFVYRLSCAASALLLHSYTSLSGETSFHYSTA